MARKKQTDSPIVSQAVIVLTLTRDKHFSMLSYGTDKCESNDAVLMADEMLKCFAAIMEAKDEPFKKLD